MPDLSFPLPSLSWFIALASVAVMAWSMGVWLGRSNAAAGRVALGAGVLLLVAWGFLARRPSVAVQLIPASLLSRVEGVAAVPVFMLVVGVAWSRASVSRQRHMVMAAMLVGVLYFVQGSWWMLQPTPAVGASQTTGGVVLQSRDDTCVAAASATVLNMLGVEANELEMVHLTHTRQGTGSTTVRAMAAMERKLRGTGYRVSLIEPGYERLMRIEMPAMSPLQFEPTRQHMVVLLRVDDRGVMYADPMEGVLYLDREGFESVYRRQVLVFER